MKRQPIIWGIILLFLLSSITPIASMKLNDGWIYDKDSGTLSIEFSAEPINESYQTYYFIPEVSKVGVIFTHEYLFPSYKDGEHEYYSKGYIETSYDRGETWSIVDIFEGITSYNIRHVFLSLSHYFLYIRFTVEGVGYNFNSEDGGFWRLWDIETIGNNKGTPPRTTSSIPMGTCDSIWNPTPVFITLVSKDSNGIKEIHYMVDGIEKIITDSKTYFEVSEDGIHQVCYWGVDILGNEEIPIFLPRDIHIDETPPKVKIDFPEKGIYLFGKKLPITINKTILIGGFDIETTPYDDMSGIYKVQFRLDDKVIGEITKSPYNIHCTAKHEGLGEISVIAENYACGTTWKNIEVYYYNFF